MKKLTLVLGLLLILCIANAQRMFYIDSEKGDDSNSGLNAESAWKTISKINSYYFQTGDQILLKRGQEFTGQINLNCPGCPGLSNKLGAYGIGSHPIIRAGRNNHAVRLLDSGYWIIENIETSGGDKAGIFIGCTMGNLEINHILVDNCYVHNIGDSTKVDWDYSTSTGGIIVVNGNFNSDGTFQSFNSFFNDIVIDGCIVRYNARWTCLSITSAEREGKRGDSNLIRNCIAEYSVADGIRMNGVQNSRIEYCFMYMNGAWPKKTGRNMGGLGAWFFNAINCTIQFCEAAYVRANETDGGAFDIDYLQENSTIQYCYGHHCAGYGVSIFGADPNFPTVNSTIRYNILSNNGQDSTFVVEGDFFIFTWNGGYLNGLNVHDNLSIWNPVIPGAAIHFDARFIGDKPNTFTKNIILSDQPWIAQYSSDSMTSNYNRFWINSIGNQSPLQPIWIYREKEYKSLEEWQKATGLDKQSTYDNTDVEIPGWYRADSAVTGINTPWIEKKALNYTLKTSRGEKIKSSQLKGQPVLISFINLSDCFQSRTTNTARSQLVFLKSMLRQYDQKGLKIILIDTPEHPVPEELNTNSDLNILSDIQDDFIIIPVKNAGKIIDLFGVHRSPVTILIASDQTIRNHWVNLVLPAQLAFAIEDEFKIKC